jgi:hypothetical protein
MMHKCYFMSATHLGLYFGFASLPPALSVYPREGITFRISRAITIR